MSQPLPAIFRRGHIELLQPLDLPDGTDLLVWLRPQRSSEKGLEEPSEFWLAASQKSLQETWGDPEDDVYAALLEG
jgi:hypothetical protein